MPFAISSRDAALVASVWTAAKSGALMRSASVGSSSAFAWALTKGRALALRSREAALLGSSWTSARLGVLARASLATRVSTTSWMQAKAGDLAQTLQDGHATASPRIKAALDAVYTKLWTLSAEARRIAERQRRASSLPRYKAKCASKGRDQCVEASGTRRQTDAAMAQSGGRSPSSGTSAPTSIRGRRGQASGQQGAGPREMP